jgi:hypothetical protein
MAHAPLNLFEVRFSLGFVESEEDYSGKEGIFGFDIDKSTYKLHNERQREVQIHEGVFSVPDASGGSSRASLG